MIWTRTRFNEEKAREAGLPEHYIDGQVHGDRCVDEAMQSEQFKKDVLLFAAAMAYHLPVNSEVEKWLKEVPWASSVKTPHGRLHRVLNELGREASKEHHPLGYVALHCRVGGPWYAMSNKTDACGRTILLGKDLSREEAVELVRSQELKGEPLRQLTS